MNVPRRYKKLSQNHEMEELNDENTALFIDEDLSDQQQLLTPEEIPKKIKQKIPQVADTKCVTPNEHDWWLCRFLAIAIVHILMSVIMISIVLSFIFMRKPQAGAPLEERIIWERYFHPGLTETSLEPQDMNGDGVIDMVMAHVTLQLSELYVLCPGWPDQCQKKESFSPCQVHILAMSGTNGDIIWDKWISFDVYALRCSHDLNGDQVPDCIVAGRMGSFAAISGADASFLWLVDKALVYPKYNFYYPLIVEDMDNDAVVDLINIHSGDDSYEAKDINRSPGFLVAISGRTGQQLMENIQIPDGHESYISPILYHHPDGTPVVVFGTGGETVGGSLWAITLSSIRQRVANYRNFHEHELNKYVGNVTFVSPFCYSEKKLEEQRPVEVAGLYDFTKDWKTAPRLSSICPPVWGDKTPIWNPLGLCVYKLLASSESSIMQPPVVIDINKDGVTDLIVTMFDNRTLLLDGKSGSALWDLYVPNTQTYSIPAPFLFNSDDTYDFIIRANKGKWMVYDYSYIAVVDGKTGSLLWTFNSSQAVMSSPLVVHSKIRGQDGMLFVALGKSAEQSSREKTEKRSKGDVGDNPKINTHLEITQKRRHEDYSDEAEYPDSEDDSPPVSFDEGPTSDDDTDSEDVIPERLWYKTINDPFPDPWTETESFIENYCGHSIEAMSAHVYFLTPDLIEQGEIKPLYTFKPYVTDASHFTVNSRARRHGSSSQDKGGKGSSHEINWHKLRCAYILKPSMIASTPAIEDLNNDGRLEVSVAIQWSGASSEFSDLEMIHPPKVIVKTFTLEDRVKEVYGSDVKIEFSSYLPSSEQPWKKYMGSQSTGEFSLSTHS